MAANIEKISVYP